MKQRIFLCIMLLIFGNLRNEITGQTDEELMKDPFWHLPAEEKVEKLLERYRYTKWYRGHSDIDIYWREILICNNPRENLEALLKYFEKTDIVPYSENNFDSSYRILNYLIWGDFHMKKKCLIKTT